MIALPLATVFFLASMPVGALHAAMVSTEQTIGAARAQSDRTDVMQFLARGEVRRQIESLGVDPAEAEARVASLSNREISTLARRIDGLPAGQDALGAVLGVALTVFIILLITDILGITNVFPFVKRHV